MLTFSQAIEKSSKYNKRHALLGNGFSISCRPDIFVYEKLFERADFSKLSPSAKLAFEALGTQDFEKVIKILRDASKVLKAYKGAKKSLIKQLKKDADGLREVLVHAIASSHPEWPGDILVPYFSISVKKTRNWGRAHGLRVSRIGIFIGRINVGVLYLQPFLTASVEIKSKMQ